MGEKTTFLESFYDQHLAGGDSEINDTSHLKAGMEAARGTLIERTLDDAIDAVQGSNVVPLAAATTLAASTVASAVSPVLSAAQNLYRGDRPQNPVTNSSNRLIRAVSKSVLRFSLQPGETINKYAVIEAPKMGNTVAQEESIIEATSGISPKDVTRLPIGTEIIVPCDPDVAVIPLGSNLTLMAKQYGKTLAQIESYNPQIKNPDLVFAGQTIRVTGSSSTSQSVYKTPKVSDSSASHSVGPNTHLTRDNDSYIVATRTPKPKTLTSTHAVLSNTHKVKPSNIIAPKMHIPEIHHQEQSKSSIGSGVGKDISKIKNALIDPSLHAEQQAKLEIGAIGMKVFSLLASVDKGMVRGFSEKHPTYHNHGSKNLQPNVFIPTSQLNIVKCNPNGSILPGGNNTQKVAFNYFVTCKGYTPAQAAGVVGNLVQESNVRSLSNQAGNDTRNPYDAGSLGWGIAQWTPGSKALTVAAKYGIHTPIYTLQAQLEMVNAEMNNVSPTGNRNIARTIRTIMDPSQAALIFEAQYEQGPIAYSGGGQLAERQNYARIALANFGSGSPTSYTQPHSVPAVNHPSKVKAVAASTKK